MNLSFTSRIHLTCSDCGARVPQSLRPSLVRQRSRVRCHRGFDAIQRFRSVNCVTIGWRSMPLMKQRVVLTSGVTTQWMLWMYPRAAKNFGTAKWKLRTEQFLKKISYSSQILIVVPGKGQFFGKISLNQNISRSRRE